jgi:hypothetical protein
MGDAVGQVAVIDIYVNQIIMPNLLKRARATR